MGILGHQGQYGYDTPYGSKLIQMVKLEKLGMVQQGLYTTFMQQVVEQQMANQQPQSRDAMVPHTYLQGEAGRLCPSDLELPIVQPTESQWDSDQHTGLLV